MKTAISIPDPVFKAAEQLAKRLGKSRSSLYTEAISSYVYEHQNEGVTEALNQIYSEVEDENRIDPDLFKLQLQSMTEEKW